MGTVRRFLVRLGESGVASIEFGLIGSAYVMMILGALEVGYMVFLQGVLDNAARDAARQLRTGQVQVTNNPGTTFSTLLCNGVSWLIPCASLRYQSEAFWQWSEAQTGLNTPLTRDASGNLTSTGFDGGSPGEIVVVTVTYNYSFFTPWMAQLLGGRYGSALLTSTVVFQNEPY
ncbi:MAG TPA: TadE/TadG family type IV pilus assembly protein [Stellaceae bacterium]|nr:TadE/TadG family type IV pilus assembly protein [Stellaceae bacterium]